MNKKDLKIKLLIKAFQDVNQRLEDEILLLEHVQKALKKLTQQKSSKKKLSELKKILEDYKSI